MADGQMNPPNPRSDTLTTYSTTEIPATQAPSSEVFWGRICRIWTSLSKTPAVDPGESSSLGASFRSLLPGSGRGRADSPSLVFLDQPISLEQQNRFRDIRQMLDESLYDVCKNHVALKIRWADDGDAIPRLYIIVRCTDREAMENADRFFSQPHIQKEIEKDFRVHTRLGLRMLGTKVANNVYGERSPGTRVSGTSIRIQVENGNKTATLGGLVSVIADGSETIYGFTAGHSLSRGKASIDPDSQPSDGSKLNTPIGYVVHHSFEKGFASSIDNYDWALIRLEEVDQSSIEASTGPNKAGPPRSYGLDSHPPSVAEPDWALHTDGIVASVMTSRGKCNGRLVSNASCIRIAPGSRAIETLDFIPETDQNFTFGEEGSRTESSASPRVILGPGDSGCWVVREDNGDICGHIVSIDDSGECYVLPFHQVFQDIQLKLNADAVGLCAYQGWPRATKSDRDAKPTLTHLDRDISFLMSFSK
ncbi:hypothetical protein PG987_009704 [Apiospora arundinis]